MASGREALMIWQAEAATYGPADEDDDCPACGDALELIDGAWQCPREVREAAVQRRMAAAVAGELDPDTDDLAF